MGARYWPALGLVALLMLPVAPGAQASGPADWLTDEEMAWIAAHPVVRVGVDPGYAPYAFFDEQGHYQGVSADIMDRLARMTGLRWEVQRLTTWAEVLDAARARRLDLITTANRRPEREAYLAFTRGYLQTPLVVMTRAEAPDMVSPDALAHQRVALVRDYGASRRVLARYPDVVQVPVDDAAAGLAAVAEGRADAYVGVLGVNLHLARGLGLANLKVNVGFDLRSNAQTIAVRKDWAPLATILDKALARIPVADRIAIDARWVALPTPEASDLGEWPDELAAWLAQGRTIRVGYEPDAAPLSARGPGGRPEGLLPDMLRELQAKAGLRLDWVAGTAVELAEGMRRGEVDLLLHRRAVHAQIGGLRLSDPLYESALMFVCRSGAQDCAGRIDDHAGQVVAARAGSEAADRLRLRPQVKSWPVSSDAEALELLRGGSVQAVLGEARALQRAVEAATPPLDGLRFGPLIGTGPAQYRMAVREDWPELVAIVNRTLESLDSTLRAQVRERWVGRPPPHSGLDPVTVWRWAGAGLALAALVLGLLLWANARQRVEIRRRMKAESELALARDQAELANRHKSVFVAQTSHELRTPLNAVIGAARMLGETDLDAQQSKLLAIADDASHGLLALVDDLLDVARIESGQLALRPAPFALGECLRSAVSQLADAAERKGLELVFAPAEELPEWVEGDGDRLRQVLVNLLGNAVKYTERGRVTLRVTARRRDREARRIELALEVIDTGPGIAPEWQERVFQPYQRGAGTGAQDAAQRLHTDGVGLGLGIARQIVRQMGGELGLDSRPGQGSRFHFELTLPLAEPPPGSAQAVQPGPPPAASGAGRVLVVEDNEVNLLLARMVLEQGGWTVFEAGTGAQALELAAREADSLDLVLTDVGLPDIDGLDLTRRLKLAGSRTAAIPVLGLTARAMPEEQAACLEAGMVGVVLKPFDLDELWQAVGRWRRREKA